MREGGAARLQRSSSPSGISGRTRPPRRSTRNRRGVLADVRQDLSEHHRRRSQPRLQFDARQAAHGGARQRGADGGPADDSGARSSPPRALAAVCTGGCRLFQTADFWPGAMKSVTWKGKVYGVPTNNETMALIWNAAALQGRRARSGQPPATWDDVVSTPSRSSDKHRQGRLRPGRARERRQHALPLHAASLGLWRRRVRRSGGVDPTYKKIELNNAGARRRCRRHTTCMCATSRFRSSALTNTQTENQDPFIAGQLGMMISHPSEYDVMLDRRRRRPATTQDSARPWSTNMRYGLIPNGSGSGAPWCSAARTSTSSSPTSSTAGST